MWCRFAECDFKMMPPLAGKFGVGCKSIFVEDGSHVLMFYPISKENYDTAMLSEMNK
jgi:hypothetical protein